jgi:hypothetical protein
MGTVIWPLLVILACFCMASFDSLLYHICPYLAYFNLLRTISKSPCNRLAVKIINNS